MNFKTETTFEGRVLNGKIVENKVVLDELLGVSLLKDVELDISNLSNLIDDSIILHSKLSSAIISKDSLKIDDKSMN